MKEDLDTWLREHTFPLDTVEPDASLSDLLPLKPLLARARIVALGESTHGTHEFFTLRHRLVRFLAQELNFRVLVVEAPWAESNLIDRYLRTGEGAPASLLKRLAFWTLNTREMLHLIDWMRDHNEQHPDSLPLRFQGCDLQAPRRAIGNVLAFVRKVNPRMVDRFISHYASFLPFTNASYKYPGADPVVRARCHQSLGDAYAELETLRAGNQSLEDSIEFQCALQSARLVIQAEKMFAAQDHAARDRYMAENVEWIAERYSPQDKLVLWAHNLHIARLSSSQFKSMGTWLAERYGAEYVAIGFGSLIGSFNALPARRLAAHGAQPEEFRLPPPRTGSYEEAFAGTGQSQLIVSLQGLPADSVRTRWLQRPHFLLNIGAMYEERAPERYSSLLSLPQAFDFFVYLRETSPSHLLDLAWQSNG